MCIGAAIGGVLSAHVTILRALFFTVSNLFKFQSDYRNWFVTQYIT